MYPADHLWSQVYVHHNINGLILCMNRIVERSMYLNIRSIQGGRKEEMEGGKTRSSQRWWNQVPSDMHTHSLILRSGAFLSLPSQNGSIRKNTDYSVVIWVLHFNKRSIPFVSPVNSSGTGKAFTLYLGMTWIGIYSDEPKDGECILDLSLITRTRLSIRLAIEALKIYLFD